MIQSSQTMATEYSYIRADQPDAPFKLLIARERGHEYSANHFGDYFYILSNDHAKNFRLMRTPVARPGVTTGKKSFRTAPTCCSRISSSSATTSC